jgi:hypothetical protein
MSRAESTFSERVGARISPELKEQVRALVEDAHFDSEADLVREALWQYVKHCTAAGYPPPPTIEQAITAPPPVANAADIAALRRDVEMGQDRVEWLLTVLLILVGSIGSKILGAVRGQPVRPAQLVDEAIQESVYNNEILWDRLRSGRRTVHLRDDQEAKG